MDEQASLGGRHMSGVDRAVFTTDTRFLALLVNSGSFMRRVYLNRTAELDHASLDFQVLLRSFWVFPFRVTVRVFKLFPFFLSFTVKHSTSIGGTLWAHNLARVCRSIM